MESFGNDLIISIRDLHKYFHGVHVLKGVDLDVSEGQLISIIGRSGCGKTTLLRCINCLEIPDFGSLNVAGISLNQTGYHNDMIPDVKSFHINGFSGRLRRKDYFNDEFRQKAHDIRTNVGFLFQGLNLFPHLTVLENIMKAPMIVKGETYNEAYDKAIRLLRKVGLENYVNRYPYQISGGQAQRVAIARALAMSPKVMLYDEPTAALDPELVEEVLQVMRNLHAEGMTQIVVTHAMNFARTASDLVCFMDDGKIIEMSSPEELFSAPSDERTKSYLSIWKWKE